MQPRIFVIVLATSLWISCGKKSDTMADPFDPKLAKTLGSAAYGSSSRQVADVVLPANRGSGTKVLILLHGGFWSSGSKADLDAIPPLVRAQYPELAIVNANYTLADGTLPSSQHPAQMSDLKLLLDYLEKNAATWHIGTNYSLLGVSSGGHLALLYAYAFDTPRRLKTVAGVVAPTNFADPVYSANALFQNVAVNFLGKSWAQDSNLHKATSPGLRVAAGAVPTFLAYAGADALVPVSQPNTLRNALVARSVPHQYFFYPADPHELSAPTIADLITKHIAFLKLYH